MAVEFIIDPQTYNTFDTESEQMDKCKEWGLITEKATKTKAFYYKGYGMNLACNVIGFVDDVTAVIEFENAKRHAIHPSYLKEMQAANYSQRQSSSVEGEVEAEAKSEVKSLKLKESSKDTAPPKETATLNDTASATVKEATEGKAKKAAPPKFQIPEEKVKMTATVKEFTTVPNHFADEDDEVIIYEAVSIVDPETEVGLAWSSHSATIKKVELEVGDQISFEAKIVKKKLTRHPVPYKINNPSKMKKEEL